MNLDRLTEQVWQRIQGELPRAFLVGEQPEGLQKYNYVNEKPYETVVIGRLSPGQLLQMPSEEVCLALLEEVPVLLCRQTWLKGRSAPELRRELLSRERYLLRLGAKPLEASQRLISAGEAKRLLQAGEKPPAGSLLTPLAKDILEGKI